MTDSHRGYGAPLKILFRAHQRGPTLLTAPASTTTMIVMITDSPPYRSRTYGNCMSTVRTSVHDAPNAIAAGFLRLSAESETVTASRCSESATARETRYRGIRRDKGIITTRPDTPGRLSPLCGMPNGGQSMRLTELAGLRCGDEALFTMGRAGMFGSDDTDPDSSLVGRRKEIPLFSPSGGTIGHDQRRERHAHHLVSTPALARPYISPVRVTDQATGSTLTGVVVFVAEPSCNGTVPQTAVPDPPVPRHPG
jgi:hypothetical protein